MSATLAIKVHKTKVKEDSERRINVTKLKVAQTKAAVQLEFRNWLPTLEEESVEPELSSFHQRVREAGKKILGFKKRKKEQKTENRSRNRSTQHDQRV